MDNLNGCGKYRVSVGATSEQEIRTNPNFLSPKPFEIQFGEDVVSDTISSVVASIVQCPEIREVLERGGAVTGSFYEAYESLSSSLEAKQRLRVKTADNSYYNELYGSDKVRFTVTAQLLNQRIEEFIASTLRATSRKGIRVTILNPENNFRGIYDFLTTIDKHLVGIEFVIESDIHVLRSILLNDLEQKCGSRETAVRVGDGLLNKLLGVNLEL